MRKASDDFLRCGLLGLGGFSFGGVKRVDNDFKIPPISLRILQ
ncbi:hypothetical protein HPNQ4161_0995 [Helicobacter pylori NQ4161]|nr:hypothetical protein HPNQ4161_0995 [Helicobacter pylori NQ4161]